jgi:hypothetical protein
MANVAAQGDQKEKKQSRGHRPNAAPGWTRDDVGLAWVISGASALQGFASRPRLFPRVSWTR